MAQSTKPRLLCVDDEQMVLDGLALHLRRKFEVVTATSGAAGLDALKLQPFAVVMSDMRMPGMDGAEFLSRARRITPDTVRVLLTGHADFEAALAAVNHGQLFRFLTKPCPSDVMMETLATAAEQHRLIQSERVLLEQTLAGSIQALIDVLSLANPIAFGRAVRLKQTVGALCDGLGVTNRWAIEIAAQLSQLGALSLPPALAEKLHYGQPLSADEEAAAQKVLGVASGLLAHIPRLEPVREVLASVARRWDGADDPHAPLRGEAIPLGARMVRVAIDRDALEASGLSPSDAVAALRDRPGAYDPKLLDVLVAELGSLTEREVRELPVAALRPGMVFASDVWSRANVLLVARGYPVSTGLITRLQNLSQGVREPVRVVIERARPGSTPTP